MATRRIPLFPLDVVLLPAKALPLHIFEPRYKLMIGSAIEQNAPFGVVRVHEQGISRIGCTALVARVVKTYNDGRMDIVTMGQEAFRISNVHDDKPYLEATVELLADEPQAAGEEVPPELPRLFERCYTLAHGQTPEASEAQPRGSLAYRLAGELPLDLDALQDLLATRAEAERRKRLVHYLKKLQQRLERPARMRSRAAGNGHGLN